MKIFDCNFCGKPVFDNVPGVVWHEKQYVHEACLNNQKSEIAPPNLTSESADGTAPEPEGKLFCERCQAWVKYQTAFGEGLVIYICKQCYAAILI